MEKKEAIVTVAGYRILKIILNLNEQHGSYSYIFLGEPIGKPGERVALKVWMLRKEAKEREFNSRCESQYKYEKEALEIIKKKKIDNGVVLCYEYGLAPFIENGINKASTYFIVSKYYPNGTLYDLLVKSGPFDEKFARSIFVRLLEIMLKVHDAGLAYLDIKLENIMIDESGDFVLIDFGSARSLMGDEGDGLVHEPLGTSCYRSPQMVSNQCYAGISADMFSLGVLLYALVARMPLFKKADISSEDYGYIYAENYSMFWSAMDTSGIFPAISIELKNLLTGLVLYAPTSRLSIGEALCHPWIKGKEIYSTAELRALILSKLIPNI